MCADATNKIFSFTCVPELNLNHSRIGYKQASFGMITTEMHMWLLVKDPHLASPPAIKNHLI